MTTSDMHQVKFEWPHPEPNKVIVTGTFDNWSKSITLTRTPAGFEGFIPIPWSEKIKYKFVVDGTWLIHDAQPTETDPGGFVNNVYTAPPKPVAEPLQENGKANGTVQTTDSNGSPAGSGFLSDLASTIVARDGTSTALGYVASGIGAAVHSVVGVDLVNAQHIAIPTPKPDDQFKLPGGDMSLPTTPVPALESVPESSPSPASPIAPIVPIMIVPVNAPENNTEPLPAPELAVPAPVSVPDAVPPAEVAAPAPAPATVVDAELPVPEKAAEPPAVVPEPPAPVEVSAPEPVEVKDEPPVETAAVPPTESTKIEEPTVVPAAESTKVEEPSAVSVPTITEIPPTPSMTQTPAVPETPAAEPAKTTTTKSTEPTEPVEAKKPETNGASTPTKAPATPTPSVPSTPAKSGHKKFPSTSESITGSPDKTSLSRFGSERKKRNSIFGKLKSVFSKDKEQGKEQK